MTMQADVAERISEIEWPVTIEGHTYHGAEPDGTLIGDDHPKAFDARMAGLATPILAFAHGSPVGPPPDGGG